MARRKKHAAHENHERWLVSYADFITLLFAFFVVMFATAQTDKSKARRVSESVQRALEEGHISAVLAGVLGSGRDKPSKAAPAAPAAQATAGKLAELAPSLATLSAELKADIDAGKVRVSMHRRGLVISLQEAAFFPSGEDAIDPRTFPSMGKIAAAIRKVNNPVRLEGHTDAMPIHNGRFRSNWDLSSARSIAVLDLLTMRFQIPSARLAVIGYAENVPVDSNESEDGRARNRRVDIVLLSENGMAPEPEAPVPAEKGKSGKG